MTAIQILRFISTIWTQKEEKPAEGDKTLGGRIHPAEEDRPGAVEIRQPLRPDLADFFLIFGPPTLHVAVPLVNIPSTERRSRRPERRKTSPATS